MSDTEQQSAQSQRKALAQLASSPMVWAGELGHALRDITERASAALEVARVGIWFLGDGGNVLACSDLFTREDRAHPKGMMLHSRDYPLYFAAIHAESRIPADDARNDPRTSEFANGYLVPLGIASMLDAGIFVEGVLEGIVCFEHVGPRRQWRPDEEAFVGTIAGIVAQRLAFERKRKSERERNAIKRQLHQSQKMEAVGTLAGGLAHDFNNLLSVIVGNAELLLSEDHFKTGESRKDVQILLEAARQAVDLVRRLLIFSRRDAPNLRPGDLSDMLESALRLLRASKPAQVRLESGLEAGPLPVMADAVQMQQVLLNLGSNAIHSMRKGGGTLSVSVGRRSLSLPQPALGLEAGDYAAIRVADTGEGMSPETRARVFEPFFTTKRPGEGTGLGLSVAYGIIRIHGGVITVESVPGAGSVFTVYLPLLIEIPAQSLRKTEGPVQRSGCILLVDDNLDMLRTVARMLRRIGYTVSTAEDGEQGWRQFASNAEELDLVITDRTMPGCSGEELAQRIARRRPELPVILITGDGGLVEEQARQRGNIISLVQKPVAMTDLSIVVRSALERSRG